jgi:hypothetical protein
MTSAVAEPLSGTVRPLDGWPAFTMELAIPIPPPCTVRLFDSGRIVPVQLPIQEPAFSPVRPFDSGTIVAVEKAMPYVDETSVSSMTAVGNSALRITADEQSNTDDRRSAIDCGLVSRRDFAVSLADRLPDSNLFKVKSHVRNAVRIAQRQNRFPRIAGLVTPASDAVPHCLAFRLPGSRRLEPDPRPPRPERRRIQNAWRTNRIDWDRPLLLSDRGLLELAMPPARHLKRISECDPTQFPGQSRIAFLKPRQPINDERYVFQ